MELWWANEKMRMKKAENEENKIYDLVYDLLQANEIEYSLKYVDSFGEPWTCTLHRGSELRKSTIDNETRYAVEHSVFLLVEHKSGIHYSIRIVVLDNERRVRLDLQYFLQKLFLKRCLLLC